MQAPKENSALSRRFCALVCALIALCACGTDIYPQAVAYRPQVVSSPWSPRFADAVLWINTVTWNDTARWNDVTRWSAEVERAATAPASTRRPSPARSHPSVTPRSYSGDSAWDRIAACESGGNWSTSTGNGYSGGLQMDSTFWRTYGGTDYAPTPAQASREQQIAVAERARSSRGYSPWPVCGARA